MSQRTRFLLLTGILIIATFLRFYHFTSTPPGLYPDEAIDGNNAAEVAQTGHFQVFYPEDNGREGLYVNLIAVILKFYPIYEPWIIRLPAALAGVLTVWGLYLLVAEVFAEGDRKPHGLALVASFLLATSFWHINFSRIGFRAILAPLLLIWALYLFLKAIRTPRTAGSRAALISFAYAVAAGAIYALGFYTYIAYRVTPLLLLLFVPFFRKTPDFWKRAVAFLITAFIVALPIGWYFLQHPGDFFGRTSEISITHSGNPLAILAANIGKTALMFNIHGDDNWRHNVSGAPELFFPVGIFFLLGLAWAATRLITRKSNRPRHTFALLLLFAWIILAMLPVVLSNEGIPHALRSILMLPPAIIFAALGGVWAYCAVQTYLSTRVAQIASAIVLAVIACFAYVDYFVIWAGNPNVPGAFSADYVAIGRAINALPTSAPKYVIVAAGGVPIRGLPTPVETTMFITNTFTTSTQIAKNVHYLLPAETETIPPGTPTDTVFYIK